MVKEKRQESDRHDGRKTAKPSEICFWTGVSCAFASAAFSPWIVARRESKALFKQPGKVGGVFKAYFVADLLDEQGRIFPQQLGRLFEPCFDLIPAHAHSQFAFEQALQMAGAQFDRSGQLLHCGRRFRQLLFALPADKGHARVADFSRSAYEIAGRVRHNSAPILPPDVLLLRKYHSCCLDETSFRRPVDSRFLLPSYATNRLIARSEES